VKNFLSPKGFFADPSKASLISGSYHNESFKSPHHSSSPNSIKTGSTSFTRELKHLTRYLDAREMQIRKSLEDTNKIDDKVELNKALEELYH